MSSVAHFHLVREGGSPPARWREAFPQGQAITRTELGRLTRSHSLAHAIIWLDGRDSDWRDHIATTLAAQPDAKLVLTSGTPDEGQGLAAVQAGCRGYAHAHSVPALLVEVALVVSHGGLWLGPALMQRLVGATAQTLVQRVAAGSALDPATAVPKARRTGRAGQRVPHGDGAPADTDSANSATPDATLDATPGADDWARLTSREAQIARAVASGQANKEIAAQMRIALKTVKAHLGSVFAKLGVRDRLQLVVRMAGLPGASTGAGEHASHHDGSSSPRAHTSNRAADEPDEPSNGMNRKDRKNRADRTDPS
jgi:DNA-binding NarL/FixJ family response regulator